jgi:hypothetical protein
MRKILAALVLVVTLTGLASALPADAAPDTLAKAAHVNTAANVCKYGEIAFFGPEPNEVAIYDSTIFHFFGLSYYKCCYVSLRYGFKVEALYLEGWDEWSWPTGDPWCPGS